MLEAVIALARDGGIVAADEDVAQFHIARNLDAVRDDAAVEFRARGDAYVKAVVEALKGTPHAQRWFPGILAGETVAAVAPAAPAEGRYEDLVNPATGEVFAAAPVSTSSRMT